MTLSEIESETDVGVLIEQLHALQQRLHNVTAGEIDAVIGPAGQTYLLAQAQQRLLAKGQEHHRITATQTALIDALPAHVAMLDRTGVIVSVNASWKAFAVANGWRSIGLGIGEDYAATCDRVVGPEAEDARQVADGIRSVLAGKTEAFGLEYPCHSPAGPRWFRLAVTPVRDGLDGGAVVMHVDISARKAAEAAALDNERRYRGIVEMLPDVIYTHSDGRITFINPAGLRLLGASSADQVLGRSPASLFIPRCQAIVHDRVARLQDAPAQVEFIEQRILTFDGREVDVEVAAWSRRFHGQVVIEVVCRDLTERKRAEAESRRTMDLLDAVVGSTSDVVFVKDAHGRYLLCNEAMASMFGCRIADLVGRQVSELFEPEAARIVDAADRHVIETGRARTTEDVLDVLGVRRTFLTARAPYRDDDGTVIGVVGVVRDISDRKVAEFEREGKRALLRTLIDALPDVIYTKDPDGRFLIGNNAALAFFGVPDEHMFVGRTVHAFLPASQAVRLHEDDRLVLGGQEFVEREEETPDHAGRARWFLTMKLPLIDGSGLVLGMVSIGRDITERRKADEQSRQLDERLSSTLDNLTDPFGIVDRDWRLLYANRKAEEMLGRPRSELIGRNLWDRIPGLVQSPFEAALRGARDTNAMVEIVEYFPPARGWFEMRIQPTGDGLALYLRNVTATRELAARFEEEHERLVSAQRVAKLGSWENDLLSGELEWSDETHRIFETDAATWRPTHEGFLELVHVDDRAAVQQAFTASMNLAGTQVMDHRIVPASGRVKIVEARWQVFTDSSGKPVRALGTSQDITERKEAEHALRRSQAMLDIAGTMAQVGGWSVDVGSMTLEWSPVVNVIHEEPASFVPSVEDALEYYTAAHAPTVRQAFERCVGDGTAFDVEGEIVTRRGNRRWVRVIGKAERDAHGRIHRVHGAFQEISSLVYAEQASRDLTDRLQTTLESITEGFFTLDSEWRFDYVNQRAQQLLGRSRESLAGRYIWSEFPSSWGSVAHREYERAMNEQVSVSFEDHFEPLGLWFDTNAYPSRQGLAVYFRDITERRRDSERMKLLETCVETLNDMVVITEARNSDGRGPTTLFVNEAFVRLTGYTREEVLGKSPRMLQGPLTDPGEVERIRKAIAQCEPVDAELVNYTKGGEPYWIEIAIAPVAAKGAEITHFVAVERDISERKRSEEALRSLNAELEGRVASRTMELKTARDIAQQANLAKSHFLATMSHEIRTPMNGVIGMIDVLHQTRLEVDQVEMIDLIRDSALQLLGIIEDILDFSKIEAGKLVLEEQPFYLAEVVEKVCSMVDHIAAKSEVGLTVFVDPAIPELVSGDAMRIRQILVNLAGNAIKFSGGRVPRGDVSVRAVVVEGSANRVVVDLIVADNGIGMDAEVQDRLFKPFSQADASTTRRFGGTGLGLAICNTLVQLMKGSISVNSVEGIGSTFTVRLPLQKVGAIGSFDGSGTSLLAGLDCVMVGDERPLGDDLGRYLVSGGVAVTRYDHLDAAIQDRGRVSTAAPLWLFLPSVPARAIAELQQFRGRPADRPAHILAIGSGKRRRPRVRSDGVVSVDAGVLSRKVFYRAVGLASGRVAPDSSDEAPGGPETAARAPLRVDPVQQGRLVLVAEDNETNRKVIQRQLHLLGVAAEIVVDGKQALEHWRRGHYAMVLTDLHMPFMDGYELAAAIRAEERDRDLPRTPIVVLTANAVRDEELRCLAAGMDVYLTKPVRLAQLHSTVEQLFGTCAPIAEERPDRLAVRSDGRSVDLEVLKALVGNDEQVIEEVLASFVTSARQSCEELIAGAARHSMQTVAESSHKMKSAARSVGALHLGELSAQLQEASEGALAETVTSLLPAFQAEMAAVMDCLRAR